MHRGQTGFLQRKRRCLSTSPSVWLCVVVSDLPSLSDTIQINRIDQRLTQQGKYALVGLVRLSQHGLCSLLDDVAL
jgi:hypothetical protein